MVLVKLNVFFTPPFMVKYFLGTHSAYESINMVSAFLSRSCKVDSSECFINWGHGERELLTHLSPLPKNRVHWLDVEEGLDC